MSVWMGSGTREAKGQEFLAWRMLDEDGFDGGVRSERGAWIRLDATEDDRPFLDADGREDVWDSGREPIVVRAMDDRGRHDPASARHRDPLHFAAVAEWAADPGVVDVAAAVRTGATLDRQSFLVASREERRVDVVDPWNRFPVQGDLLSDAFEDGGAAGKAAAVGDHAEAADEAPSAGDLTRAGLTPQLDDRLVDSDHAAAGACLTGR